MKKRKIEPILRMIPATDEGFALLRQEMLEYSLSLDYSGRLRELSELRAMAFRGFLPSAKIYQGWRNLNDEEFSP